MCFFRPGVLADSVKTLAVGHECPLFSHHSCRLASHAQFTSHPDHNTTTDFHNVSETSSFHAAPTPDSLQATPTRRDFLCSSNCVADFSAARTNLRPLHNLRFVLSLTSLSLHRHGHHGAQETRNQQLVGQVSVSRPAALELPSRVSKSHPVPREFRSVCLPSSSHARFVTRSRSQPDLFVRLNLVHEELFSTLPQQRSLLLIHRLQVALDFAVVWSRIACRSGSRSACLIFLVSCGFVLCPDNGMLSALHKSLSSVLLQTQWLVTGVGLGHEH